ncbi:MAG: hypothetical protein M1831_004685 [Alyxoria varia]|nr:MAG: hypothetical protein M1831_004685 [Alyxoria varia]
MKVSCYSFLLALLGTHTTNAAAFNQATPSYTNSSNPPLPTIDLGYSLHRANHFNADSRYYNFSNIRFAAPPIGPNLFRAPILPAVDRSLVNDGSKGHVCPRALPIWQPEVSLEFLKQYFQNKADQLKVTQADLDRFNASVSIENLSGQDGRLDLDCLFLDVMVPEKIWNNNVNNKTGPQSYRGSSKHHKPARGKGATVLVWIYGGGYVYGDKGGLDPAGLINSSQNGSDPVIFVAMNYRTGAFGFLAGPTFQRDGLANAAFYDQRLALEWVQQHIHKFGGDPDKVTVIGESAGAGSIEHHLVAFKGTNKPLFRRAVIQSPAFQLLPSPAQSEATFKELLDYANVTSLSELRKLPAQKLIEANGLQIATSPYGQYTYGPVVDNVLIRELPGKALSAGHYIKDVDIMVGHNINEGIVFTDPFLKTDEGFRSYIRQAFPMASNATLDYLTQEMYPPPPQANVEKGLVYPTQTERLSLAIAESTFSCNGNYLSRAYPHSYAYLFTVPFGYHGLDLGYTFYNGGGVRIPDLLNVTVARALQDYVVSFARDGRPVTDETTDGSKVPVFEMYGGERKANVQDLGLSRIMPVRDAARGGRCRWWQEGRFMR